MSAERHHEARVVVGIDGSPDGDAALREAAREAVWRDGSVVVVAGSSPRCVGPARRTSHGFAEVLQGTAMLGDGTTVLGTAPSVERAQCGHDDQEPDDEQNGWADGPTSFVVDSRGRPAPVRAERSSSGRGVGP